MGIFGEETKNRETKHTKTNPFLISSSDFLNSNSLGSGTPLAHAGLLLGRENTEV